MTEDEFLEKWQKERPIYEAWGGFVAQRVQDLLTSAIAGLSVDMFLRIPVKVRLKRNGSLIDKAFYRKSYPDPYEGVEDKVGLRFVVLLASQIDIVENAVISCSDWHASKDKDYQEELEAKPYEFTYQSLHYVVRSAAALTIDGLTIPKETPCEIQIRTLLQHAHCELTHDTIYKPKISATPAMKRSTAKSMALIEATSDYFEQVMEEIENALRGSRTLSDDLAKLYRQYLKVEPEITRTEDLILDAFDHVLGDDPLDRLSLFLQERNYLQAKIIERAKRKLLYRQPSILLTYLLAFERSAVTQDIWPLTRAELAPVYTDLGLAFDL